MKSEVFNTEKEKTFPKLMTAENGIIVLMLDAGVGTVMHQGNSTSELGIYRKDWAMSAFADFNGKVTLSNE